MKLRIIQGGKEKEIHVKYSDIFWAVNSVYFWDFLIVTAIILLVKVIA